MTREQLDEHIRQLVADWPPFTPGQAGRLRALLRTAQPVTQPSRRKAA